MSPRQPIPPIRQRDIVQLRGPRAFARAVVLSGDAFNTSSGVVIVAPLLRRNANVPYVELALSQTSTVVSLSGLRPVSRERIAASIGSVSQEQLDALLAGLDLVLDRDLMLDL